MKKILKNIGVILTAIVLATGCQESGSASLTEQLELGQRYLAEANYEEAIVAFNKVIEIDPNYADAYVYLGQAYYERGEAFLKSGDERAEEAIISYESSINAFMNALNMGTDSSTLYDYLPRTYVALINTYIEQGDYETALVHLKAAKAYIGDDDYAEYLGQLHKETEFEEAQTKAGEEDIEESIVQWQPDLTPEETVIMDNLIRAINSEDNAAINTAAAHSGFIELIQAKGENVREDYFGFDYGDTINGKGLCCGLWITNNNFPWIYIYYGDWKEGLAEGTGVLLSIACNNRDPEGWTEQFEKASGTWKDGYAEGSIESIQTFFGGSQSSLDTINGQAIKGVWDGEVSEKSINYVAGNSFTYISYFDKGIIRELGTIEDWNNTMVSALSYFDGNELSPHGAGGVGQYEIGKVKGVIQSRNAAEVSSYENGDTYKIRSISWAKSEDEEDEIKWWDLY